MYISELPMIGEFQYGPVYDFYDKPLLFKIFNTLGDNYIVSFAKKELSSEKWLASRVSLGRVEEFERGLVSIRDVFAKPETGSIILFDVPTEGIVSFEVYSPESQEVIQFMADPDEYINSESISYAEATSNANRFVQDGRRAYVNLRLDKISGTRTSLDAKQMGNILVHFQDTVNNIGMNILGLENERGRLPNSIIQQTNLDFAVGWNGSVGITLLSSEDNRLINNPILEQSLAILFDLLESDAAINYFFDNESGEIRGLSKRTLLKFKSLLSVIRASNANLDISTGSRYGYERRVVLSHSAIEGKVYQIGQYADSSERLYRIRGIITAVNTSTGRLEILDQDSSVKYVAYVGNRENFEENRIEALAEYVVNILEFTSVNNNTGEEVNSYTVLNYSKI